jgi:hypothetical protein
MGTLLPVRCRWIRLTGLQTNWVRQILYYGRWTSTCSCLCYVTSTEQSSYPDGCHLGYDPAGGGAGIQSYGRAQAQRLGIQNGRPVPRDCKYCPPSASNANLDAMRSTTRPSTTCSGRASSTGKGTRSSMTALVRAGALAAGAGTVRGGDADERAVVVLAFGVHATDCGGEWAEWGDMRGESEFGGFGGERTPECKWSGVQ